VAGSDTERLFEKWERNGHALSFQVRGGLVLDPMKLLTREGAVMVLTILLKPLDVPFGGRKAQENLEGKGEKISSGKQTRGVG